MTFRKSTELKSYHFSDGKSLEIIFLDTEVKICHGKLQRRGRHNNSGNMRHNLLPNRSPLDIPSCYGRAPAMTVFQLQVFSLSLSSPRRLPSCTQALGM